MSRFRRFGANAILLALFVVGVAYLWYRHATIPAYPPIGKVCTVQFRRDALGTASPNPVPPMTNSMNGADTCITGTLISLNEEWAVVRQNNAICWIPRSGILLISVDANAYPPAETNP